MWSKAKTNRSLDKTFFWDNSGETCTICFLCEQETKSVTGPCAENCDVWSSFFVQTRHSPPFHLCDVRMTREPNDEADLEEIALLNFTRRGHRPTIPASDTYDDTPRNQMEQPIHRQRHFPNEMRDSPDSQFVRNIRRHDREQQSSSSSPTASLHGRTNAKAIEGSTKTSPR